MGGKSTQTQQTQQQTNPWEPAQPALNSILGGLQGISPTTSPIETSALDALSRNAQGGNPFTGALSGLTNSVASNAGVPIAQGAYDTLRSQLTPTANGDYLDPNKNPFFGTVTNTIGKDVMDRLSGMYAGAGRDPSGAGNFGYNLARGISEGTAPTFANVYNTERGNQIGAANALYGAGNSTASLIPNLTQGALSGTQAGADATLSAGNYAPLQELAVEAQRRGIPLSLLSQIAGIATPIAGLGGQSTGSAQGTSNMSLTQQIAMLLSGAGSLFNNRGGTGAPQIQGT